MTLVEALSQMGLSESVGDYLLGRGLKAQTLQSEGFVSWSDPGSDVEDRDFVIKYGPRGANIDGYSCCPVWSPKGTFLGFEARSIRAKVIEDFRCPEAKWNPFLLGAKTGMPRIWAGGDIWVCEGVYDKAALEWVVPEKDVVVSTFRAHLSAQHVQFFSRFCTGYIHMVYDNDETGRKATHGWVEKDTGKRRYGALDLLRHAGLRCRDVPYTGGKDPGEIWDSGGEAAIKAAFRRVL